MQFPRIPSLLAILIISITIFTTIVFNSKKVEHTTKNVPTELIAVMRPIVKQIDDFTLKDQNNKSFSKQNLSGRNTLLFFGYTSCPDICPTTLTTLTQLNSLINDNTAPIKYQIIFVSVDSKRDTVDRLDTYMNFFNKDFLGVTGDKASIDSFTKQFAARYEIEGDQSKGDYQISHTSSIFLINTETEIIAAFSPPHHAELMASQLQLIEKL